jgi:UDP-2,3-diacylglucosamine hydrolase
VIRPGPAPALFLSDLHLSPANPAAVAAFAAFARGPARNAAAVYILGDLFDVWVGDDQLRSGFYRRIAQQLRAVRVAGAALYVARGNRDFLIGEGFADATGATLLDERTVLDLAGAATLLMHGDELCTDDVAYQRFRARTRTPQWRAWILGKPYWVRRGIAAYLRLRSRRATAHKEEVIMDVNDDAVAAAFRAHDVTRMIHGHTHRPALHALSVDGVPRERHVLAAWHDGGQYLEADHTGVHVRRIQGART